MTREVARDIRPHIPLIVYTFLSLFTRLYRIGANNSVVWDEVSWRLFLALLQLSRTFIGSLWQVWRILPQ